MRPPRPGNANLPIGASQKKSNPEPLWHSRGYLPHLENSALTQHVTFHLADSLPQDVLRRFAADVKLLAAEKQDAELRKRLEAWFDAGHGSCVLLKPAIGEIVQRSLLCFDAERYRLLAWVVMPNHVHVLFQSLNGWTVAKIVVSWKKFTARKICDHLRNAADQRAAFPARLPYGTGSIGIAMSGTYGIFGQRLTTFI